MDEFDDDYSRRRMLGGLNRLQRLMFIHDLEQYPTQKPSLNPEEFISIFGEPPTDEDMEIITQLMIKDIHSIDNTYVLDKWGADWINLVLEFNVEVEEYELCAVFKEVLDSNNV